MPSVIKRRGRPKGHLLTTIGLPRKKGKSTIAKKPCSFLKLHTSEKERGTHAYNSLLYVLACIIIVLL